MLVQVVNNKRDHLDGLAEAHVIRKNAADRQHRLARHDRIRQMVEVQRPACRGVLDHTPEQRLLALALLWLAQRLAVLQPVQALALIRQQLGEDPRRLRGHREFALVLLILVKQRLERLHGVLLHKCLGQQRVVRARADLGLGRVRNGVEEAHPAHRYPRRPLQILDQLALVHDVAVDREQHGDGKRVGHVRHELAVQTRDDRLVNLRRKGSRGLRDDVADDSARQVLDADGRGVVLVRRVAHDVDLGLRLGIAAVVLHADDARHDLADEDVVLVVGRLGRLVLVRLVHVDHRWRRVLVRQVKDVPRRGHGRLGGAARGRRQVARRRRGREHGQRHHRPVLNLVRWRRCDRAQIAT
eukprot:Unigene9304_Nuclearia_a/m.28409 Unigene9304_Nuclearia_a/g.28409  ORF Unigene9304_Nuclearia_a/g.28409 Unigene9304_Nuclearia_a/m.28409 type:complete len:356 (+) Unigene9304_Nuclearia_a:1871-2938(+)